ncbi:hypothetical protein [Haloferula sp.]|uniref:hypothetical protein n=1 Tax=Haloferula sp. TaxID=2497595 RepID=UPI003C788E27
MSEGMESPSNLHSEDSEQQGSGVGPAPSFDEVVSAMRSRGINKIEKARFRIEGGELRPVFLGGEAVLITKPNLEEPEFWIPEGFDGYSSKWELCVPPWMLGDPEAIDWYARWKDAFRWPDHGEYSENSMDFVRKELATLRCFSDLVSKRVANNSKSDSPEDEECLQSFALAANYLEKAMVDSYTFEGRFPPREQDSLSEGESLPLSEKMARIIEGAYRAGKLDERASTYYREIPEIAKRGRPHVDQQGRKGSRKAWLERVSEIFREKPDAKAGVIADILEVEGVIERVGRDWTEGVRFNAPGEPDKDWAPFRQAIKRIKARRDVT